MDLKLVTIHTGPLWEVQLVKGRLELRGIETFIPDETTKVVDPFITGANPLTVDLQVPSDRADEARAHLAEIEELTHQRDPDEVQAPHGSTEFQDESRLGRAIRWLSILFITAPIALALGVVYLWRLKPGTPRPRSHRLNVAAIFLSLCLSFVLFVYLSGKPVWLFGS